MKGHFTGWPFRVIYFFLFLIRSPTTRYPCMNRRIPLEEGDYYWTPEGYRVFTAKYLLRRGYCCESGCRHCPYGFDPKTQRRR